MEYRLQRMDVGLVVLDERRNIVSLNPAASRLLGGVESRIGRPIQDLHGPGSREKVELLLEAAKRPDAPPSATSMIVALPGRMVVAKVTSLPWDGRSATVLMLFDLGEAPAGAAAPEKEPLVKLPVATRHGVALIDPPDVVYLRADGHYSTVHTAEGAFLCSLPLSELERRLDGRQFVRSHRGYIVNLVHAQALERIGDRAEFIMAAPGAPRVPVSRGRIEALKKRLAF
ncbi:LytTR family transcriptional regulator DNA-binding domain-containing protein [Telmatospirillum sp. J64-1]|uniref:LytTR family transcriptional regulator DNA-binding domain-containing protein n=1 Tax=Telmatospirillum sp. J64-1 TaxID=2502183 RepID=UPI00115EEA47|nr:LytTR family transcriptional regulator DNA-binding domain-containing protein [Telmatospirillum sp. J64-1]